MIMKNYKELSDLYTTLGNVSKAFEYFKLYTVIKDFNSETQSQLGDIEAKYENEKIEKELTILAKEKEIEKIEVRKKEEEVLHQKIITYILTGGFFIILVFAVLLFKQMQAKKKTNQLLALQNEEINQKNIEITNSISYAKTIQQAVLSSFSKIQHKLPEHFVLFKPKDIISGDFYWAGQKGNKIFIAAADCTGHGVPGAFMSILGMSLLNEIFNEKITVSPAEILNRLREKVITALSQKGNFNETKDGMDIALCSVDLDNGMLEYAGANNPLYLFKNHTLMEIDSDSMPIAIYDIMDSFTNHQIVINQGDCLYIFSDGYMDQIGGPDRKKFKYKRFKELLSFLHDKPMEEQRNILKQTFDEWRGDMEQLDDVLVIGIKI
jgi:serine phosphatase RsbU (regulator of sigma subunit)